MGSHSLAGHCGADVLSDEGFTPVPALVQWMVTLACELRCPHCLAADDGRGGRELDLAEALALVDEVADANVPELLLTGGEPLVRPDLPTILERIAERGVPLSLNTAVMPRGETRRALEQHPPAFVAVSLDGPAQIHDAFRGRTGAFDEALESMRFFRGLGSHVAAGTTVTRRNVAHLARTLAIVHSSAAHEWGLHLLVPEGRARDHRELSLDRRELRRLVRFVEQKRRYVPLQMADEMGFCGDREPLLRDLPLTCGAGRAQCVVLPDGEVVPCTTSSRSHSAGNVRRRALLDIWRDGFGAQRSRSPRPRCRTCEYFAACGGGCWLQTRERPTCYRDVWSDGQPRSGVVRLAVVLGLGAAACSGASAVPDAQPATTAAREQPAQHRTDEPQTVTDDPPSEPRIAPGGAVAQGLPLLVQTPRGASVDLAAEVGAMEAVIVRLTVHGPSPERAAEIVAVRPPDAAADPGWAFVLAYAEGSTPADVGGRAAAIRSALATRERSLALAALLYRSLAEGLLDGPAPERRTDAQRRAVRRTLEAMSGAVERWRREIFDRRLDPYLARDREHVRHHFMMLKSRPQPPPELSVARDTVEERWGDAGAEALAGWLSRHPYAESMRLRLSRPSAGISVSRRGAIAALEPDAPLDVHDVLITPQGAPSHAFVSSGSAPTLAVELPAAAELTHADVLRLVDQQHRARLERLVADPRHASEGNPLWLPMRRGRADAHDWLVDFWLF